MTNNVAAVDVNIAEMMSNQENQSAAEKLQAAMEANPVLSQLMDAAQTVDDMYQVVKECVAIKIEDFRILMDKTINYFKGDKVKLDDELLDCVDGGGWFGDFWNKHKRTICAVVVVAGMAVLGAAAGAVIGVTACVLAGTGLATGGCVGAAVGGVIGAVTGGLVYKATENNKP